MLRNVLAAGLALAALALAADPALARHRRVEAAVCTNLDVMRPCTGAGLSEIRRAPRRAQGGRALKLAARHLAAASPRAAVRASLAFAGRAVSGLVAPLAAKVAEIQAACGSSLVSGVRHTVIAGTRTVSLHASGKAADMAGNPACIYARLAGWPGGYTVDYSRVRHVHLSWDPDGRREWGLHFRHGGGRHHHMRHARHREARR